MNVNNPAKLLVMILVILCATLLRITDDIDVVTYVALVGPIGGYAVGNGIAAKNGAPSEPMFAPRDRDRDEG